MSVFVRFRIKYGQVSIIKDKILSYAPVWKKSSPLVIEELTENIGNDLLNKLEKVFNLYGDNDCFVNGYFSLTGKTSSCGDKSKKLSDLIKNARLYSAAFWNAGLRKGIMANFSDIYCLQLFQICANCYGSILVVCLFNIKCVKFETNYS